MNNLRDILKSDLILYLKQKRKAVNKNQAEAFKRLNIFTVSDLLYFAPSRYIDYTFIPEQSISEEHNDKKLSLFGYISKINVRKSWTSKIPMTEAELECISQNNKKIKLFWFNQAYIGKIYKNGDKVLISGKIEEKNNQTHLSNPYIEKLDRFPETQKNLFNQNQSITEEKILPIYKETQGITSRYIFECIKKILPDISANINNINDLETLPGYIIKELNLPDIQKTFLYLHAPRNENYYKTAQKRILFEEIFYLQLNIIKERQNNNKENAYNISINKKELEDFYKREKINPTRAQLKVIEEILKDFKRNTPMQRLLEGDVGSGKTLVAAAATLATINNNKDKIGTPLQTAYLAPTEILARQQFESFIKYFKHTNISIGYLSGKEAFKFPSKIDNNKYTKISKPQLVKWIKDGQISVLVGTHAITKKSVVFKDLAFIIIDEQHRFGVNVRRDLAHKKGDTKTEIPHLLSMTATPIPRTLAISIFGDLDLSIIDELPKGRIPIITKLKRYTEEKEVFKQIKQQISEGRQVFVVCTKISDSEDNRKSVENETKRLKGIFVEHKIEGIHSKTNKDERDKIMEKFKENKINILVSTSIIEVGVNIPNASIIIIQDADRFGLSQLHQMRGRVGRSSHASECILFTGSENEDTLKRLKTFEKTLDGFTLAEEDLKTRGPGGILSGKQSGLSDIAMEAIKNIKLVDIAKKYAKDVIEKGDILEKNKNIIEKLESLKDIHLE